MGGGPNDLPFPGDRTRISESTISWHMDGELHCWSLKRIKTDHGRNIFVAKEWKFFVTMTRKLSKSMSDENLAKTHSWDKKESQSQTAKKVCTKLECWILIVPNPLVLYKLMLNWLHKGRDLRSCIVDRNISLQLIQNPSCYRCALQGVKKEGKHSIFLWGWCDTIGENGQCVLYLPVYHFTKGDNTFGNVKSYFF